MIRRVIITVCVLGVASVVILILQEALGTPKTTRGVLRLVESVDEEALARGDFSRAIYVASVLQKANTNTVRAAFATHPRNDMWTGLILLRLMFEVEGHDVQWAPHRWITTPEFDIVHGSWPLDWNAGHPQLVAQFLGFTGFPYEMAEEYDYLLKTSPFRNLHSK